MKYTVDQHVVNLERMLEKDDPCEHCPWDQERENIRDRLTGQYISLHECFDEFDVLCKICTEFIGFVSEFDCPCTRWGEEVALKRTHLALEEYHEKH